MYAHVCLLSFYYSCYYYYYYYYYYYQNRRSRFGIERHPYTKSRIDQIPCVCMYVCVCVCVCVCNYSSQTTESICIKIIPGKERLTLIVIGYLNLKYLPPPYLKPQKPSKRGVNRHFQAKLA